MRGDRDQETAARAMVAALFRGDPMTPVGEVTANLGTELDGNIHVSQVQGGEWADLLGVEPQTARWISGVTWACDGGWTIAIREADPDIQLVALAHELGHIAYGDVTHGDDVPARLRSSSSTLHIALRSVNCPHSMVQVERRAEQFAALFKAFADVADPARLERRHPTIDPLFDQGPA